MGEIVGQNFGSDGIEEFGDGQIAIQAHDPRHSLDGVSSFSLSNAWAKYNSIVDNSGSDIVFVNRGYAVDPDTCPTVTAPVENITSKLIGTNAVDIGVSGISQELANSLDSAKCFTVTDDFAKDMANRLNPFN